MPEIETQTDPCNDVIDKLNEEFSEIYNENESLKKDNESLKKDNELQEGKIDNLEYFIVDDDRLCICDGCENWQEKSEMRSLENPEIPYDPCVDDGYGFCDDCFEIQQDKIIVRLRFQLMSLKLIHKIK